MNIFKNISLYLMDFEWFNDKSKRLAWELSRGSSEMM